MPPLLDSPPPLPDAVKSQMGGGSFAGIGDMLSKSGGGGGGAVGLTKTKVDTIKKVLQEVIQSAGAGKTFFSQAMQLLDKGVQAEGSKGPGSPAMPASDSSTETASFTPPAAFPG